MSADMHLATPAPPDAARRLEAVTDTALARLSLDALLDELLNRVCAIFAADTAAVLLVDGDALVPRARRGLEEALGGDVRIPIGKGFAGRVAAAKRPVMIEDIAPGDLLNPLLREQGIHSLLGVPILFESKVIGVLHVGTLERRRFHEPDAQLLQVVADRIGLGIEYARLYDEEQRVRAETETERARTAFLANVTGLLAASLDYEATLRNLVRLAVPDRGECCVIDIADEPGGATRRVAVAHVEPAKEAILWEIERRYPMWPEDPSSAAEVARTGKPVLLAEVTEADRVAAAHNPEHLALMHQLAFASSISVPLIARGRTLGTMSFATSDSGRRYGLDDLALARDLASLAALAVDNARLYREAQESRAQAVAASRAKDEFLATVSHELRTPLTPILTWARLLDTGRLDPARAAQAIKAIQRSAKAQVQLIEDLLDVSRIITGKLRLNMQRVELSPVIEAAVEAMRPAMDAKGIQLQMDLDPRAGAIAGDPERLQQVVWNLLSNTIKFTPKGGRVQVALARGNSHVELTVRDTGSGIAPAFLPHLFERFSQEDASTTRPHGGLGLGLAIVRHLVELHRGTVRAESAGEGKGALVTVRLPLPVVAQKRAAEDRGHPTAGELSRLRPLARLEGVRVLVVDDERETCEALEAVLADAGAAVRTCLAAEEAVPAVPTWRPHVVIADIGMPGTDGYAFIRKVRALAPQEGGRVPAVALTAYARAEDRVLALSAGFQMHVAKPVEPAELVAVVATLTRGDANPRG
jgi:signal transduction histidine kinase/CheY-like chemotaxis protein/putative methionine-R-sulfoxide reductase with GAF domain